MPTQQHILKLEAPETPDFAPQISDLRERLARLEERTENPHSDPALAESLSLASEAHRTTADLKERLEVLEKNAADRLADVNAQAERTANEVSEVSPPIAIETPPPPSAELDLPTASHESHHPWWHPLRYL